MRVLVTGSSGTIGSVVAARLRELGDGVVEFDLAEGHDILDLPALGRAARGCDAVVHLAADVRPKDDPRAIMETNLLGTWNVLLAAREASLRRVVYFSSVNALGIFLGERAPDYLPIDDEHPSYARRPYGLSKRLAEEMCRAFTEETEIPTICLRPPAVWDAERRDRIRARWREEPAAEWTPIWEYGAFVDVRDVADAAVAGLRCADPGHVTLLLCADDIAASRPSRESAEMLLPDVEWRGGAEYERDPWRALVDSSRARAILGWSPRFAWTGDSA